MARSFMIFVALMAAVFIFTKFQGELIPGSRNFTQKVVPASEDTGFHSYKVIGKWNFRLAAFDRHRIVGAVSLVGERRGSAEREENPNAFFFNYSGIAFTNQSMLLGEYAELDMFKKAYGREVRGNIVPGGCITDEPEYTVGEIDYLLNNPQSCLISAYQNPAMKAVVGHIAPDNFTDLYNNESKDLCRAKAIEWLNTEMYSDASFVICVLVNSEIDRTAARHIWSNVMVLFRTPEGAVRQLY